MNNMVRFNDAHDIWWEKAQILKETKKKEEI